MFENKLLRVLYESADRFQFVDQKTNKMQGIWGNFVQLVIDASKLNVSFIDINNLEKLSNNYGEHIKFLLQNDIGDTYSSPFPLQGLPSKVGFLSELASSEVRIISIFNHTNKTEDLVRNCYEIFEKFTWISIIFTCLIVSIFFTCLQIVQINLKRSNYVWINLSSFSDYMFLFQNHLLRVFGNLLHQHMPIIGKLRKIGEYFDIIWCMTIFILVQLFVASFSTGLVVQDTSFLVNNFKDIIRLNRTPLISTTSTFWLDMRKTPPYSLDQQVFERRLACGNDCDFRLEASFVYGVTTKLVKSDKNTYVLITYANQAIGWMILLCTLRTKESFKKIWVSEKSYYNKIVAMIYNTRLENHKQKRLRMVTSKLLESGLSPYLKDRISYEMMGNLHKKRDCAINGREDLPRYFRNQLNLNDLPILMCTFSLILISLIIFRIFTLYLNFS